MTRLTKEREAEIRELHKRFRADPRVGILDPGHPARHIMELLAEIDALREEAKQMCDVDNRHCIDEITSVYAERDILRAELAELKWRMESLEK